MKFEYAIQLLTVELEYVKGFPDEFAELITELEQAINILKENSNE